MDLYELSAEAKRKAQIYAPEPNMEPTTAGITGAVISSIVMMVFMRAAGLDSENFGSAITITMLMGFAGGWWYYRQQRGHHDAAVEKELSTLRRESDF
jgi:hypothetical protein